MFVKNKENLTEFLIRRKKAVRASIKNLSRVIKKRNIGSILGTYPQEKRNHQENRRIAKRIFARVPVYIKALDAFYMDYSVDISEGGISVESLEPLQKGQKVDLTLAFSSQDQFDTQAEVAWSLSGKGIAKSAGLRFDFIDNQKKDSLTNIIYSLKNTPPSDS
ncbi:MAG TPA: PilZ domain-containing protein [bacterium]